MLPSEDNLETVRTSRGETEIARVVGDTVRYARERSYTGWDYADGMSSQVLQSLPVDNKWVNILFQETIKRAPVNIRPYLLVEQRRNFKGTALFALANLNLDALVGEDDRIDAATDDVDYETEARELADWLVDNRIGGYSGFCGGHRHQIQWLNRKGYPDDPDVVSTSYAVKALLRTSSIDPAYAETAATAADFVFEDLEYTEAEPGAKIKYVPAHSTDHYTLNAVALGARLLIDLYDHAGERRLRDRATKLLDYVVSRQVDDRGWMYRDPPSRSHLSMDNHHNGFIIECLLRYQDVCGSTRYADTLDDAIEFYRETLFEPDGTPNWDETNAHPKDIHAAAQGVLVFTRADELEFANRILEWTLRNLHDGNAAFYFQKRRFYTKRFTLMRWCQAWMAYAMTEYLAALKGVERGLVDAPKVGDVQ